MFKWGDGAADKYNFQTILKHWLSKCNQNKQKKNSCSTYHLLNVIFSITTYNFLTTGKKLLLASECLLSFSLSSLTFAALQKPCQGNFGKFQESGGSRFGNTEKDR